MPQTLFQHSNKPSLTRLLQCAVLAAVPLLVWCYPNAPAKYAGAPGDSGTCATCHGAAGSGSIQIAFPAALTYTPGVAQRLQVTITDATQSRWGFSAAARPVSNPTGAQAGSFSPADANTQVLCSDGTARPAGGCPAAAPLEYIGQTAAGNYRGQGGLAIYTFDWFPPATDVGNVIICLSGVAANNDGTATGDHGYSASYTLAPSSGGTAISLNVTPGTLAFNSAGGATPAAQTLQIASTGGTLAWTAAAATTSGGNWLSVTPSGSTPGNASVSVNPAGLAAATYNGTITVSAAGASNTPQSIPVTLTVTAGNGSPTLVANPTALTFHYHPGEAAPAAQTVNLTSTGAALSFTWTIATTSGGSFIAVSSSGNTTPATVSISAAPDSLAPGTYSGSVAFNPTGAAPVTVPVTLVIANPEEEKVPSLFFHFVSVVQKAGGSELLHMDGSGHFDADSVEGKGSFTAYHAGNRHGDSTVLSGKWRATKLVSFTSGADAQGSHFRGALVMEADFDVRGGDTMHGTITVAAGTEEDDNNGHGKSASAYGESAVTIEFAGGSKYVSTDNCKATFSQTSSDEDEDGDGAGNGNGNGNANGNGNGNGNGRN